MSPKWFRAGIIGAVIAVICCVTPLAVVVLGALGLSAFAVWIDVIAVPAVLIFGTIAIVAYVKRGSA